MPKKTTGITDTMFQAVNVKRHHLESDESEVELILLYGTESDDYLGLPVHILNHAVPFFFDAVGHLIKLPVPHKGMDGNSLSSVQGHLSPMLEIARKANDLLSSGSGTVLNWARLSRDAFGPALKAIYILPTSSSSPLSSFWYQVVAHNLQHLILESAHQQGQNSFGGCTQTQVSPSTISEMLWQFSSTQPLKYQLFDVEKQQWSVRLGSEVALIVTSGGNTRTDEMPSADCLTTKKIGGQQKTYGGMEALFSLYLHGSTCAMTHES
ncbi:hypothetical protein BDK51DRAFT_30170 [Blyttiomyces helicus]|uniref:Uncharacterized protein n=1 Tax=Blyttiomyces helicus TaxID=388810 RepID=A0A4P9WR86_9FUNG|nr:hypothetical protein BDK51DRAFT_30170 [Blyttiomyces helicus]|eukprot:RKO93750.1 hypothetical protein BDK51DRAFT_30170 [Blyttiomyces helicus]